MVGSLACSAASGIPRAAKSSSCTAIIAVRTPRRVRSARTPTPSTAPSGRTAPPGTAIPESKELAIPIGVPPSNAPNLCAAGHESPYWAQDSSLIRLVCSARPSRSNVARRSSSVTGRTSKSVLPPILPSGPARGIPISAGRSEVGTAPRRDLSPEEHVGVRQGTRLTDLEPARTGQRGRPPRAEVDHRERGDVEPQRRRLVGAGGAVGAAPVRPAVGRQQRVVDLDDPL